VLRKNEGVGKVKIEKAIETLSDYKMQSAFEATPDFEDALKLGIEAMERVKLSRKDFGYLGSLPLQGEDE